MGSTCTKRLSRNQEAREGVIYNLSAELHLPQPVVTTEEDVMIADFTRETFGANTLSEVKEHLANYIPVDFRCSRERPIGGDEGRIGTRPHSYVSIVGRQSSEKAFFHQLAMEVDFQQDGIEICIGTAEALQQYKNRKSPIPEQFFFAEDQAVVVIQTCEKGFHEVIDWVWEHRYKKAPQLLLNDPEEENLGRQLYDYIRTFYN